MRNEEVSNPPSTAVDRLAVMTRSLRAVSQGTPDTASCSSETPGDHLHNRQPDDNPEHGKGHLILTLGDLTLNKLSASSRFKIIGTNHAD